MASQTTEFGVALDTFLESVNNSSESLTGLAVPYTHVTLKEENMETVVASGIIPKLIALAKKTAPEPPAVFALISLVNMAIFPVTHKPLLDAGALEAALGLIAYLRTSTRNEELDCGLSAAFLICRTVGKK